MASKINASTTGGGGVITSPDASGVLDLQSNGTTIASISSSGLTATNLTVTGTLTTSTPTSPAFSAYQSSSQALSSLTLTKIQFQTKEFDINSNFDNTTNYRFTPNVAGYYQINASLAMQTTATVLLLYIYKNGSGFKNLGSGGGSASIGEISGSALVYMNGSTDYLEIYGYSGVAQNIAANSVQTYFQAFLARSA